MNSVFVSLLIAACYISTQTSVAPLSFEVATGVTLSPYLTSALTAVLGVPVVDKTGLTGAFDFTLKWSPDERQFGGRGLRGQRDPMGPSLFTALQEQLGLRLIAEDVPFEVIVVDSVEKPSSN